MTDRVSRTTYRKELERWDAAEKLGFVPTEYEPLLALARNLMRVLDGSEHDVNALLRLVRVCEPPMNEDVDYLISRGLLDEPEL